MTDMTARMIMTVVWGLALCARMAVAAEATAADLDEARRWAGAKFEGIADGGSVSARITVVANNDPVQCNARTGTPLNIAGTQYVRGLYCHAASSLIVRLPGPAQRFTAVVGVDANGQTSGGRGSVVFRVRMEGKDLWRSGLMREGMAGAAVTAELSGAREFSLDIQDGGDGISCDQADWAEAKVTLADGSEIWLGDLPVEGVQRGPHSMDPPFSFNYGGKSSRELLPGWKCTRETRAVDEQRTEHTLRYADPDSALEVRCVAVTYRDFPTVEWTLHFKNTGTADTPVLSEILSLDTRFERDADGEFVLRHHRGDVCAPNSFEPMETKLTPGSEQKFASVAGRPTNGAWPYYRIDWPGGGVIAVIGWPGQWSSAFLRDGGNGLRVCGGQELTHFVLHPGEEARSPLSVLQFYRGDPMRAQNVWRRWMFACNFPKPKEGALGPVMAACSGWQFPGLKCNQQGEISFIDRYLEEGVKLDYWWMDAGWYPCGDGWPNVGTWEVDKERYPDGIRAVSDHAHAKGVNTLLWFEPERVTPGSWLYQNHPEWLLGAGNGQKLLNLGNADARAWLTDHVDKLITEQGLDLYRQDFNIDPLPFWRANDAEDRQGITEMRHIEGYLAYWDALRARHPGMLIDSCASGGRRDDLESMRRAVPLLRTDCEFIAAASQCHTYGFDQWLPYHCCGNRDITSYDFRSDMGPWMGLVWDVRKRDLDYPLARTLTGQWREVAGNYLGDMYPLTPYSTGEEVWMAWQFDRPDLGTGLVQAFRRAACFYDAARLPLRGLNPEARYTVTDLDKPGAAVEMTGRELMETGLRVNLPKRPAAALFKYALAGK
jgi:alpha-galactosidase